MPPSDHITRRGLLGTLGGISVGGVATGTVAARHGGGHGRVTHADRGVVVQFEDCETAYVRGNRHRIDYVVAHFMQCFGGGGPCPDGSRTRIEEDPPLTIDDRYLTADTDYYIAMIEYSGPDVDGLVRLPESFDCEF